MVWTNGICFNQCYILRPLGSCQWIFSILHPSDEFVNIDDPHVVCNKFIVKVHKITTLSCVSYISVTFYISEDNNLSYKFVTGGTMVLFIFIYCHLNIIILNHALH